MRPDFYGPTPGTDGYAFTTGTHQTVGPMHWSNYLQYLLYLLHSTQTISALSFYQTGSMTAGASPARVLTHALNETSQADNLNYLCTEEDPPSRNLPLDRDCDNIIDHLIPFSTTPHEFHKSTYQNDQDSYKLPYQLQFGTCVIVVDLVPGYTTETSSWLIIKAIATGLTRRCVHEGLGLGGSVGMGSNFRMIISVFGSLREYREGNETTS